MCLSRISVPPGGLKQNRVRGSRELARCRLKILSEDLTHRVGSWTLNLMRDRKEENTGLCEWEDGGAWWAAVCGVTQSQTQLKRLSSRVGGSEGSVCWRPLRGWRRGKNMAVSE